MNTKIQQLTIKDGDEVFGSNKVFDLFKYSAATKANGFIFISGQVGLTAEGTIPTDPEEQTRVAFQRLEQILAHYQLGFDSVVELTSYHTNPNAHLAIFRQIKDEFLQEHRPAWSIIGTSQLAREDFIVEIKAVALAK